jgi:hypothetical protein
MIRSPHPTRYNQPIPHMGARTLSGLRLGWLASFLLAAAILPSSLHASTLEDAARQFANKIAAAAGSGTFGLDVSNRSSLDEKSTRQIANALEAQLNADGVRTALAGIPARNVSVVLSESLRDYVWTARIYSSFSDSSSSSISMSIEERVVMISLPRPPTEARVAVSWPMVLKATLLFSQQQLMLDLALAETPGGARLIVLNENTVAIYRQQSTDRAKTWPLEISLPISLSRPRPSPRDLRGRLILRRDHLFDVYLPGTFCQSSSATTVPLVLSCQDSSGSDLWPLTSDQSGDDSGVRAFFTTSRNFFTGSLSPAIGKIANVPSFYSAAVLPRPNSTLWVFAAVDGSVHLVDGISDQLFLASKWGSDLAAVRSTCGSGIQLLVSESSKLHSENSERADLERAGSEGDSLRAFEFPNREPIAVSPPIDFDGTIVALWSENSEQIATAIVRNNTGWYDAYRIAISCSN